MTEPVATEHKRRRRAGWKISAALLLLALIGLGIAASMRRTWRTVRLEAGNGGSALIVEVPPDWEGISQDDTHSYLTVTPPRPTGFVGWWDKNVLKIDLSKWEHAAIQINIQERDAPNTVSGRQQLERIMQILAVNHRQSYKSVKMTPILQSGMAGYDLEALYYGGTMWIEDNERCVMLRDYDPVRHCSSVITVILRTNRNNYSLLKPTMDEIIRRLKLVQEK